MAPSRGLSLGSRRFAPTSATLGFHVDVGNLDLPRSEVGDLVESSKANFSFGLAFRGLPFGLARNGRGVVHRRNHATPDASIPRLVLRHFRYRPRCHAPLACSSNCSPRTAAASWVDGDAGSNSSPPLRHISTCGPVLAVSRSQRLADHVRSSPGSITQRVLGQTVESRIPPACA